MQLIELTYPINKETTYKKEFMLCSDLHMEHHLHDIDLFNRDFGRAKKENARILINGDVFDFILYNDKKRYVPANDRFAHRSDSFNAIIEYVTDRFTPYADNIDVIGIGNHETAVLKYHSNDPVRTLIQNLNQVRSKDLPLIQYAGYSAFVKISFVKEHRPQSAGNLWIYMNHGQGGSAEVTKGAINLARRSYVQADIIWLGHSHTRMDMDLDSKIMVSPNGQFTERPTRGIITGCYLNNYEQYDIMEEGYRSSYGEERQRTPQAKGAFWLSTNITKERLEWSLGKI